MQAINQSHKISGFINFLSFLYYDIVYMAMKLLGYLNHNSSLFKPVAMWRSELGTQGNNKDLVYISTPFFFSIEVYFLQEYGVQ